jgi:Ca2+-binding EF-hand superfamily protein
MANNIISGLLTALTSTKTKTYNDTTYGDQIGSSRLKKYNTQAKELFNEYDANGDGYLSTKEAKEMPLFEGQDLSTEMFDRLFKGLAQRGMSQVELSRTLQLMDKNEDGEVKSKERNNFMENVVSELENGTNPNKVYAELSAEAIEAGGAKSTGDELRNLKAQFERYGIDKTDYTSTDPTDEEEDTTGLEKYKPLIEAGLPLLQGLMANNKSKNTDTNDFETQAQALALQKQQLEQQLKLQQLQASTTNASSLGAGAFPTALPTIPALATPTLANFLPTSFSSPLLAGSNSVLPTIAMPAQTTFAQAPLPVVNTATQAPVASGFTFSPATPTVATAPVTPSTAWIPPAPVAQAQVPIAPTLVAQAPANGGW